MEKTDCNSLQIIQKRSKMCGKQVKTKTLKWVSFQSFKNLKWRVAKMMDVGKRKTQPPFTWSHHLRFTYLQNCHYWVQDYKNATIGPQIWLIHLDDVEMMWQLKISTCNP